MEQKPVEVGGSLRRRGKADNRKCLAITAGMARKDQFESILMSGILQRISGRSQKSLRTGDTRMGAESPSLDVFERKRL